MTKAAINARLDTNVVRALKGAAKERGQTLTEHLESILHEHQNMSGPSAAERRIAALESQLAEQDRIIRKHTGRPTPKTRRVTLSLPIAAAQALEKMARQSGATKSQLITGALEGKQTGTRIVLAQPDPTPALV